MVSLLTNLQSRIVDILRDKIITIASLDISQIEVEINKSYTISTVRKQIYNVPYADINAFLNEEMKTELDNIRKMFTDLNKLTNGLTDITDEEIDNAIMAKFLNHSEKFLKLFRFFIPVFYYGI
jgi:uncharacterized protein YggT (Ycf19 family)